MLLGTREAFAAAVCPSCGVLWLEDPPDDLSPYYPPEYHGEQRPSVPLSDPNPLTRALQDARAMRILFGRRRMLARVAKALGVAPRPEVNRVRGLVRQSRLTSFRDPILDVGAGRPERLELFQAAGFRNLLAIDPYVDDALDGQIPVLRRTLDEVEGAFALVMFHHSFEHVRDPRATMRMAANLLTPGGTLLIRTPVMGSWFWDEYGTDWWELDPPRHLFVHSEKSLTLLAREMGLCLIQVAYESAHIEILASEQIRTNLPWRAPGSWFVDPPGPFGDDEIEVARRTVQRLNLEGRAGRAMFLFRREAAAP